MIAMTAVVRIVCAALLFTHGVAHLVGFAVPWKLVTSPEAPYHTTVLAGALDVGRGGARVVGVMWLVAGAAFAVVAGGLLMGTAWWLRVAVVCSLASAVLCVIGLPDSRIGLVANVVLLGLLFIAQR